MVVAGMSVVELAVSVGLLLLFSSIVTSDYVQRMQQHIVTPLPIDSTPDLRRWRHDGSQHTIDLSNRAQAVNWPEVSAILS